MRRASRICREACGLPAKARCAPHTELRSSDQMQRCRCKPTECFIVWPIKHCHHSLQPIAPTHFARIQPRPNGLWKAPTLSLLLNPLAHAVRCSCLSELRWGCLRFFIVLNMHSSSTEVGTMTSTSSARSIHSGKQSLPPIDTLFCCHCARRLGCSPLLLLLLLAELP